MSDRIVLGLTGEIACGKGAIKKYLMDKYAASDYRFSTILRDILKRLHLEVTRENLQHISTVLRQNFGEDLLAHAMAQDIKNDTHPFIVIDGIRRLTDIKYLRQIPEFRLVQIVADSEIRYNRVLTRNENVGDDKKTWEEFLHDHEQESENQVPEVMKTGDYEITNEGTFEELEQKVDYVVADIKAKQK
jgi:dephospho-CoA kinase